MLRNTVWKFGSMSNFSVNESKQIVAFLKKVVSKMKVLLLLRRRRNLSWDPASRVGVEAE